MRVVCSLLLAALLAPVALAQEHLFDVVRFGSLQEVTAQVGAVANPTNLVDSYGQDLLVYAANSSSDPEVIRYLVRTGFNVNMLTPERWTPLMYAVRFNPVCAIATTLLELGATAAVVNSAGMTARDLMADGPNPSCATAELTRLLSPQQQVAPLAPPVAPAPAPPPQTRTCCRYCSSGKACGDSCIARSNTCRRGAGCACNTVAPEREIVPMMVLAEVQRLDLGLTAEVVDCPIEWLVGRLHVRLLEA